MCEVPGTHSGHLETGPTVISPVTEVEPNNNRAIALLLSIHVLWGDMSRFKRTEYQQFGEVKIDFTMSLGSVSGACGRPSPIPSAGEALCSRGQHLFFISLYRPLSTNHVSSHRGHPLKSV